MELHMDFLEVRGDTLSSADECKLLIHVVELGNCVAEVRLQILVLLHNILIVVVIVVDIFVDLLCTAVGVFDDLPDHDQAARTNGLLRVLTSEGYPRTLLS